MSSESSASHEQPIDCFKCYKPSVWNLFGVVDMLQVEVVGIKPDIAPTEVLCNACHINKVSSYLNPTRCW